MTTLDMVYLRNTTPQELNLAVAYNHRKLSGSGYRIVVQNSCWLSKTVAQVATYKPPPYRFARFKSARCVEKLEELVVVFRGILPFSKLSSFLSTLASTFFWCLLIEWSPGLPSCQQSDGCADTVQRFSRLCSVST